MSIRRSSSSAFASPLSLRCAVAALLLAVAVASPLRAQTCIADCNSDGEVSLGEVQIGFSVFLGTAELDSCGSADSDRDGEVELGEVQQSFNQFLGSCEDPDPGPRTTYYVRAGAGSDSNTGSSAANALKTIGKAVAKAAAGDEVIVGPGVYEESVVAIKVGTAAQPIALTADPLGVRTGDAPGEVVIDGSAGTTPALRLSGVAFFTVSGFTIRGGAIAGIQVRGRQGTGSRDVAIRDCQVSGNQAGADGILVQDSSDVLLFNNLVVGNGRRGIAAVGSPRPRLINNTVFANGDRGIYLVKRVGVPSSHAFLRNNISQENGGANLQVATDPPSSLDGFDSERNLIFPDRYQPSDLPRPSDINADALFVRPEAANFRLALESSGQTQTSPAVDAGVEANPPDGPQADFAALRRLTTATDGALDEGPLDLGFHALPQEIPVVALTFFVRAGGSDDNGGTSPDQAFATIGVAAGHAKPGDFVLVGPGSYFENLSAIPSGTADDPISIVGDASGEQTGDPPGAVVVDARGRPAPFRLSSVQFVVIAGFVLRGGTEAGASVRDGSSDVTVRDCEVRGNATGILVQNSSRVLLFNDLVDDNDETGIVVGGASGSADVRLVNDTVVANGAGGIRIGTTGMAAAADTLIQNVIVQDNAGDNLAVNAPSLATIAVRYNLVFPPTYSPAETEHPNDVNADARFASDDDRRLGEDTPAVDAGDPETDPALAAELATRTVLSNGAADIRRIDLGYHFAR